MEGIITQILVIAVLILFSAYFSATETAYSSMNKTRLKTIAEKDNKKAKLALKLSENYDKLLSTILIGNNIVNIATASIATILFVNLCDNKWDLVGMGPTLSTIVITIVVLIFGEITPKSIAKDSPEKFAMFSAPFLSFLIILLTPINFVFSGWKKLISKIFKSENDSKMSQEELLMLVDEVQQDGSIDENEGDLLKNAIEFTERQAEDILTHRVDLEAVPITATKDEISRTFAESKFSRILVYDESIDNIVGVIHLKDFYTEKGITNKPIKDIISPVVFVLETTKINAILRELQKKKSHIAVVVDEYGGTCGIVTMEDILEELVGEIWDEHDEEDINFKKISPDTTKVNAGVDMEDFCEVYGLDIETESVSLGGWIMEQLGQVPNVGDVLEYENLKFTILSTDNHRIDEVMVKKKEVVEEENHTKKNLIEKLIDNDRDKDKDKEKDKKEN